MYFQLNPYHVSSAHFLFESDVRTAIENEGETTKEKKNRPRNLNEKPKVIPCVCVCVIVETFPLIDETTVTFR